MWISCNFNFVVGGVENYNYKCILKPITVSSRWFRKRKMGFSSSFLCLACQTCQHCQTSGYIMELTNMDAQGLKLNTSSRIGLRVCEI